MTFNQSYLSLNSPSSCPSLDQPMAQNLLPIRILFHAAFALVYFPTIALAFVLDTNYLGPTSLSALAGLVVFLFL